MIVMQEQFIFHRDPNVPDSENEPAPPTEEQRRWAVDWVNNKKCPLFRFVGNDHAKRKIAEAAFVALARGNHCIRDLAIFLSGPPSVGKTQLMRLLAELLGIPFVEILPRSISDVNKLFAEIRKQMEEQGLKVQPIRGNRHFRLPPCIIFVDEVHGLKQAVVDALLKACEGKDCTLVTERGEVVNCCYVCWAIATTEVGDIFDAFESRFDEIQLSYYTREELAYIVHFNNPDLGLDVCRLIAKFQRLPRKLLRFATSMRNKRAMHPAMSWEGIALEVAKDNGIDEFGMAGKHLAVLKALKTKPVAKDRLPVMIGVKKPELEKKLLPLLLCETADQPALVEMGGDGYKLTEAGHVELARRGL
jgi:Holliday junction resolvasome RuvABC ATP-dependent DNA helicase subunit